MQVKDLIVTGDVKIIGTLDANVPVASHSHTIAEITNLQTTLDGKAPAYSYGTSDLTAGSSSLATGKIHLVYE